MERPPATLNAAALLLTAFAIVAAWNHWGDPDWSRFDDLSWVLAIPPLASLALLRRSRAAWGLLLLVSFHMAAFGAVIALAGARRAAPDWFVEHFRWTALFWLAVGTLLSARPTRRAVWVRA